jgi:hypothetical protein
MERLFADLMCCLCSLFLRTVKIHEKFKIDWRLLEFETGAQRLLNKNNDNFCNYYNIKTLHPTYRE